MLNTKALAATAAAPKVYIEDVMSTWLYTGNGSTQTITNGIDLSGKGGLVWIKGRDYGPSHGLFDTARGVQNILSTDSTSGQGTSATYVTSFNSTGFSMGSGGGAINTSPQTYAAWTFRKQAKFFDVVTYTGTGSNRTIAHNLGSVPGCIIVKGASGTYSGGFWTVYHRSLSSPSTAYLFLNNTAAAGSGYNGYWNGTAPTSAQFSVGNDSYTNGSGTTYVAYLFAHDAGGFGDSGSDSVVKCGSYTTPSSGSVSVDLGWEPQWVLLKSSSNEQGWRIIDNMRGFYAASQNSRELLPDTNGIEVDTQLELTATGFSASASAWGASRTFIYIAIRRGPMKTPTDATKVFTALATSSGSTGTSRTVGFPADFAFARWRSGTTAMQAVDRLRGMPTSSNANALLTSSTAAEAGASPYMYDVWNTTAKDGLNANGNGMVWQYFRRAPGFFDVVAYTGDGGSDRALAHNLGAVPELALFKKRSSTGDWLVCEASQTGKGTVLNTTDAFYTNGNVKGSTSWTASTIYIKNPGFDSQATNGSSATYIAYLFASCPGVSKVGSYTGTGGTPVNVDCGFTNGARFVLVKRTDTNGSWYVWDTARGIVSGVDPFLLLESTAAEFTIFDDIDPYAAGFQISGGSGEINGLGGTFIYLAIA